MFILNPKEIKYPKIMHFMDRAPKIICQMPFACQAHLEKVVNWCTKIALGECLPTTIFNFDISSIKGRMTSAKEPE